MGYEKQFIALPIAHLSNLPLPYKPVLRFLSRYLYKGITFKLSFKIRTVRQFK